MFMYRQGRLSKAYYEVKFDVKDCMDATICIYYVQKFGGEIEPLVELHLEDGVEGRSILLYIFVLNHVPLLSTQKQNLKAL